VSDAIGGLLGSWLEKKHPQESPFPRSGWIAGESLMGLL
jgi:hypothetical protein